MKFAIAALSILVMSFPTLGTTASVKADNGSLMTEATMILQGIIEGIAQGDYAKYTRNFSELMKASQNREDFLTLQKRLQKTLGRLQSMEYFGLYVQRGNTITLFKARFSREKDDVLIKLVLEGVEQELRVTGLWFDSPSLDK